MRGFLSKRVHPVLAMLATLFLALLSLVVGCLTLGDRLDLLEHGRKVPGVVVGIDVGVRGLKSAEVEFVHTDGRRVVGRDLHGTQWFAANDVGDEVMLYYDPLDAEQPKPDVLVDRGWWIWSIPSFLVLAGIALAAFAVFLYRQGSRKGKTG